MKARSIWAVIAGFLVNAIPATIVDIILHATGVFPPWGEPMPDSRFMIATAYRIVFGIAGCYVAARLAPSRPMAHALALGIVGVVLSTAATIVTWNRGPAFGPHWYPIALILVSMPCAWIGGKLATSRQALA